MHSSMSTKAKLSVDGDKIRGASFRGSPLLVLEIATGWLTELIDAPPPSWLYYFHYHR